MNPYASFVLAVLVAGNAGAGPAPETGARIMDARVETSSGGAVQLATRWGKPTVLFYEDRESTALNQRVKDALFERGQALGLLEAISVVAVANVATYDWFPARNFVLAAVQGVERQFKVSVYLDFEGALAMAPWQLPAGGSTIVLLDARGVQQGRWTGRLSEDQREALFSALEGLLTT